MLGIKEVAKRFGKFPFIPCYTPRRLKGGEPARRGRSVAKRNGEVKKLRVGFYQYIFEPLGKNGDYISFEHRNANNLFQ